MKITDVVTITELSRLMNKSRPTIYKYISDFELNQYEELPQPVVALFQEITSGNYGKKDIYTYCDNKFVVNDELNDIFVLIKENVSKLNLRRLREFIEKEIR